MTGAVAPAAAARYEPVIGIEVHIELATESKIFCGCATRFGVEPNTQVCPVCLGHPGVLPVLNLRAVEYAIRAAVALGCTVSPESQFARKNYFYPDLPKGYQITQLERSLAHGGRLDLEADLGPRSVTVARINLEEEAAKSLHPEPGDFSLVDYNRAGVPLIEVVSGPDLRSPEEARAYLTKLRSLILYTGISDCRMQEGSFRFDANISLRPLGSGPLGTLVELKNLNSFRHLVRALEHEIARQAAVLDRGEQVRRETRAWDEARGLTVGLRGKERSDDYRYFPEPDLALLRVDQAWVDRVRAEMPELPAARRARLQAQCGLGDYQAGVIVADAAMARFYDQALAEAVAGAAGGLSLPEVAGPLANWVTGDLARLANLAGVGFDELPVGPAHLAELTALCLAGRISGKMAKEVLDQAWRTGRRPEDIVEAQGLRQVTDPAELAAIISRVIAEHPGAVDSYRAGKGKALGFLVGQVMAATRGRAHPELANRLVREALEGR